jgi:transcription antitermination factor NusG
MVERFWTVAQTVSKMEHVVRRDIEKADHGAFVPTYARHWSVDGRAYAKECALFTGYVFFMTEADDARREYDWAGIPDIHGVYRVPANANGKPHRVRPEEMMRVVLGHAAGDHDEQQPARFTKFYNPQKAEQERRRKNRRPRPRRSRQFRANTDPCST